MTEFALKDSGKRQEFETGARRDTQEGKGRYDLISTVFLKRLAVVMEKGAVKYGDRNWEKGMPLSRYLNSAIRHLLQLFDGECDEDHAGQAAFNVMAFLHTLQLIQEGILDPSLDDRPNLVNQRACVAKWANPRVHECCDECEHPHHVEPLPDSEGGDLISQPDREEAAAAAREWFQERGNVMQQGEIPDGAIRCNDGVWRMPALKDETVRKDEPIQEPICGFPTPTREDLSPTRSSELSGTFTRLSRECKVTICDVMVPDDEDYCPRHAPSDTGEA